MSDVWRLHVPKAYRFLLLILLLLLLLLLLLKPHEHHMETEHNDVLQHASESMLHVFGYCAQEKVVGIWKAVGIGGADDALASRK